MSSKKQTECPICLGIYMGDDINHHTCNKCWNCPRIFDTHPNPKKKKVAERYNKDDRFQPYYNTCVSCAHKQINPPPIIKVIADDNNRCCKCGKLAWTWLPPNFYCYDCYPYENPYPRPKKQIMQTRLKLYP